MIKYQFKKSNNNGSHPLFSLRAYLINKTFIFFFSFFLFSARLTRRHHHNFLFFDYIERWIMDSHHARTK